MPSNQRIPCKDNRTSRLVDKAENMCMNHLKPPPSTPSTVRGYGVGRDTLEGFFTVVWSRSLARVTPLRSTPQSQAFVFF